MIQSFLRMALASLACAAEMTAQARDVTVRVRSDPGARPLPNAEVVVVGTGERRFTSPEGVALLRLDASRAHLVRVRQIGFSFRDITIAVGVHSIDVDLQRIPFALPAMRTRASSACDGITPDGGALEAWALEQLREGAERYATFTKAFPFDVTLIRHTVQMPGTPRAKTQIRRQGTTSSRWGDRYVRGDVVRLQPFGYSVAILFLPTLGDSLFWESHCAVSASVVGDSAARRVRLMFVPAPKIKTTDWEGQATLDSATSALLRVEFRLRVQETTGPRRFEGYTTFIEASPYIRVPDTTIASWWREAPRDTTWGLPSVVQRIHVESLRFKHKRELIRRGSE